MTDYSELVKALRHCSDHLGCTECPRYDAEKARKYFGCGALEDAAAAIEALEAQLPKRGEWIKHTEVKNIYGGVYIECPFCGEKYVVQYVPDEKFCRNCGADLRAMMEVQDV